MITDKTKTIATAYSADVQRLMNAMGIKDKLVTAFSLSVSTNQCVEVSVTRCLTEAELAVLTDELEENPLKAEGEHPAARVGFDTWMRERTEDCHRGFLARTSLLPVGKDWSPEYHLRLMGLS